MNWDDRKTERQKDRKTERQKDRKRERQKNKNNKRLIPISKDELKLTIQNELGQNDKKRQEDEKDEKNDEQDSKDIQTTSNELLRSNEGEGSGIKIFWYNELIDPLI